jgi:hypothetical protein
MVTGNIYAPADNPFVPLDLILQPGDTFTVTVALSPPFWQAPLSDDDTIERAMGTDGGFAQTYDAYALENANGDPATTQIAFIEYRIWMSPLANFTQPVHPDFNFEFDYGRQPSPVPEPSTWALMVLGAAATGFGLRLAAKQKVETAMGDGAVLG